MKFIVPVNNLNEILTLFLRKLDIPEVTVPIRSIDQRANTAIWLVHLEDTRIDAACNVERCRTVQILGRVVEHVLEQAVGVEMS